MTEKAASDCEGYTYPEGAMTRGPLSVKRKLSSQDSTDQSGRPQIAHRAVDHSENQLLARWVSNNQQVAKEPRGC